MSMNNESTRPDHELGALPEERPCGEDHRDVQPGYDLDEQAVYAAELRRRAQQPAGTPPAA